MMGRQLKLVTFKKYSQLISEFGSKVQYQRFEIFKNIFIDGISDGGKYVHIPIGSVRWAMQKELDAVTRS